MRESILTLLKSTKCKASQRDLDAPIGPWTDAQRLWLASLPIVKIRFKTPDHCAEIRGWTDERFFIGRTPSDEYYLCDTRGYDYPREMLRLDWTPEQHSSSPSLPAQVSGKPGMRSNAEITRRNGGVEHQFIDDIGGCSANYR